MGDQNLFTESFYRTRKSFSVFEIWSFKVGPYVQFLGKIRVKLPKNAPFGLFQGLEIWPEKWPNLAENVAHVGIQMSEQMLIYIC